MSKVAVTRSKLDNLAVAISGKSGESLPLTIDQMRVAVQNIIPAPPTTPYYMWQDSNNYIHISSNEHGGYQIDVSNVEEHYCWTTIYDETINTWESHNHCFEHVSEDDLGLISDEIYRVTYDGVPYIVTCENHSLGSNVYSWDGESPLEYPFEIFDDSPRAVFFDVTTNEEHTFVIEHREG